MIECLVCHVDNRFNVKKVLCLDLFTNISINTLAYQKPPYVPSIMSITDDSYFPTQERVSPTLNINDFKVSFIIN